MKPTLFLPSSRLPTSLLLACSLTALALFPNAARAGDDLQEWARSHALENGAAACLQARLEALGSGLDASDTSPDRSLFVDPATGKNLLNYPPHRVVDFSKMKLDIRIPDMNVPTFDATCTLTLSPISEDLTDLTLDAKRLAIKTVSVAGSKATFKHDGLKVAIAFDPPLPMGKLTDVVITYTLTNPPEGLFWTPESGAWPGRPAQIHTQGEPETNSFWFPCHDFPNDKLATELSVTVPRGFAVSSNGRLVNRVNSITPVPDALGKTSLKPFETWTWAQDERAGGEHASYLVSLIVGKFDIVDVAGKNVTTESSSGLPRPRGYTSPFAPLLGKNYAKSGPKIELPVYVPVGRGSDVVQTYGRTGEMIRFFSALFAHDYQWSKYAQLVVHNFAFGGMENTSATTMFDTAVLSKDALIDHDLDGLISHELGHQWFGDLMTCNSWEHVWLNEGFATYLTGLWYEHRDGADAYQSAVLGYYDGVVGADRGKAPETPGMVSKAYRNPVEALRRSANCYGKGASILSMLRAKLGDEVFFKGIRTYVDRFHHKSVETDDLRKTLEEVSGESLEQFFQQWTRRPGVPRIKVSGAYADGKLTLDLTQNQPIDGYNPAFVFDLPVTIRTASGKLMSRPWSIDSKTHTLVVELPEAPASVWIDPDLHTLAEITLDEPTAWLLDQAKTGSTLSTRVRAIRALSARHEPGVQELLRTIATSNNEHRQIRSESIRALESLGDAEAIMAALASAKGDAQIRIQAIDSLSAVAGKNDAAPAVKQAAIEHATQALGDPAIRARASALHALVHLKATAELPTVLAAGTRDKTNDSQHDIIRQTVADSLAEIDSPEAFRVALDISKPGTNSRTRVSAINALAKLAHHDRPTALAALGNYLADPEIRSRRAAISGLAEIGTPEAIALLKARVDSVLSPYEHADIERTIRDAEKKLIETTH